ncbi:MAG TPA: SHOCT domain-containing protein [Solirubrobacterales bacterium]|nr:SHOCT domain-containing protein [Solirubrobacterales bacterium]
MSPRTIDELGLAPLALPLADTWGMHDGDIGAGWMIVMMLGTVLLWTLIVLGIVWLLREAIGHNRNSDPLTILDRRLAEGKLSPEEYEQRRRTLAS